MKRLLIIILFALAAACQHDASRVRCDLKLQPINAPTPIVKEPAATSATTP